MYFKFLVALILSSFISISMAQNPLITDTVYYRYDHSIGTKELSNYYKIYKQLKEDSVLIEEYYRFTTPHQLKARYTETKDGKKNGPFSSFTKSGMAEEEGIYRNNEREGIWLFYRKGQWQRKVPYRNGKQHGIAVYFVDHKELYQWTWKDDRSDGYNVSYHDNGNLRYKGTYSEGKRIGVSTYFFESGGKQISSNYVDGTLDGSYEYYHENGQLRNNGQYQNGLKVDEWVWFREDGSLSSSEFYKKNGKLRSMVFYNKKGEEQKSRKRDMLTGVVEEKKKLHKIIVNHVRSNFDYPTTMYSMGFEAKVSASFIIDKEGRVKAIKADSNAHKSFDIEAMNILRTLPKQTPAIAHNIPIEVSFVVPIVFRIER